jgi:tetratricopeptide (TPR) repeat protein
VTGLLAAHPDDADALQLKTEAESCTSPSAPPVARTQPPAQPIPPENGGLEPLPGELDRDYQVRVRTMRARYDEVVAISSKGPSPNAIEALQALARDTPPRYLDVAARLAEARRAWLATAQPHLNEGRTLAGQGKWSEAIQKLNQARSIDPSLSIDADLRDIEAAKAKAAAVACEEARGFKNYNRKEEAVTSYRRVLALAQPDHPCYVMAKEYVDSFGR